MSNAWTGGQYSLFRAVFGLYLFAIFAQLLPDGSELFSNAGMLADSTTSPFYPFFPNPLFIWDSPLVVHSMIAIGILASLAFTIGLRDRGAALLLWFVWACLLTRNPLISNLGLPFIGWLLLAHAALPRHPFGSWDARGRPDPDSGWNMPNTIYIASWVVMAIGYSYSGAAKLVGPSWLDGSALANVLADPLAGPSLLRETLLSLPDAFLKFGTWSILGAELLFAPLALIPRLRRWLWLVLLLIHLGLMTLTDFADFSAAMALLHFFTFNPAWIAGRVVDGHSIVFYDGACGLCHRTIRVLLAEDADGDRFRFAPLETEIFEATCAAPGSGFEDGTAIPDSVLVHLPGRALLTRSQGLLELGHQLGGLWRLLAWVLGLLPLWFLNAGYDLVARTRHHFFSKPDESCPLVPAHLRDRFHS